MDYKKSKTASLIIIGIIYIAAAIIGVGVYMALPGVQMILRLFLADVAATVFVFVLGVILKNSSVYDPYWSVAPAAILALLASQLKLSGAGAILILIVVIYWGARLTWNWAYGFKNLNTQDWRYDMLKKENPRTFGLINFVGIHLMPTIIVFLALIPAVYFIQRSGVNALTIVGCGVSVGGATLELVSDLQMQKFRRSRHPEDSIMRTGLWKYARHPNYLGEIAMWWGVYLTMLSVLPAIWYLLVGALVNTVLFLVVSIPMAEKRLSGYKAGYSAYKSETRMLWPLPVFKKNCKSK